MNRQLPPEPNALRSRLAAIEEDLARDQTRCPTVDLAILVELAGYQRGPLTGVRTTQYIHPKTGAELYLSTADETVSHNVAVLIARKVRENAHNQGML